MRHLKLRLLESRIGIVVSNALMRIVIQIGGTLNRNLAINDSSLLELGERKRKLLSLEL